MTRSRKVTVSKERILIWKSTHILTHMYFIKNQLQVYTVVTQQCKNVSESMSLRYLNVRNTYVVQYGFFTLKINKTVTVLDQCFSNF